MSGETRAQWQWLQDTYWYVDSTDLLALQLDPASNQLQWMTDQTVWHISGVKDGYFWGVTAAMMYPAAESQPGHGPQAHIMQMTMLGTVFPDGQVQITFQASGRRSDSAPTIGYGRILPFAGGHTFEMQMSTAAQSNRLLHWANMMQTKPGEASYKKLPGLSYSVPQMLEGADYPEFKHNK